jgi:hypothetical protein
MRNSQQSISFRRRTNIDGYQGLPMPSPPILHHRMGIDGCFSAKTHLVEPRRLPMAAGNRAITFLGPHKIELQNKGYPKLQDPKGKFTPQHTIDGGTRPPRLPMLRIDEAFG